MNKVMVLVQQYLIDFIAEAQGKEAIVIKSFANIFAVGFQQVNTKQYSIQYH